MHLYTNAENGASGSQRQRQPEKKGMAELLVNEHAVGSLLDLGNTKVGGREGRRSGDKEGIKMGKAG